MADESTESVTAPAPEEGALRKIIHCDCDCFYAAIEMRDDRSLRGKPLAVGGASERRGVVATCNYEARRFGIHSAMPTATALRRCPHLLVVPPRMDVYREVSTQVQDIFSDYTDLIEPLSLDEAYLDVSGAMMLKGSATLIAREIRSRVRETLGITISAGVASNKFLAKIASDWNKPDGQYVILPEQVDTFVLQLPVRKLSGVGKVMAGRLTELGVETCEQLRAFPAEELMERFGKFGLRLYELCRGIDRREVQPERIRKSLSVENTYPQDLAGVEDCLDRLPELFEQMRRRLSRIEHKYRVTGLFVKLKFNNFVITSMERASEAVEPAQYEQLTREAWARHERPVRLMGVGVRLQPREVAAEGTQEPRQMPLPL
ncbi:MAG: DNA polymerase IV [Pseudohongiellaceae bacterium]